jgi:DNA-directed RNA polymerase subunit RPC12/RpoP
MYQARHFGPLPESVEHVIGLIERDIASQSHYACIDCRAAFADTHDLGIVTEPHIQLLDPTQHHPAGICPICGSEVHPKTV